MKRLTPSAQAVEVTREPTRAPTSEPHPEDPIEIGQWYWVKNEDQEPWLGCVTRVGSNYGELSGPRLNHSQWVKRILLTQWGQEVTRELDPARYIQAKVQHHQQEVQRLMGEVRQLAAALGLVPAGHLGDGREAPVGSTALAVVHGVQDVRAHKQALIVAKDKTLPELFKQIEHENAMVAGWMQAETLPLVAQGTRLKQALESIDDKIFTVELYAGLCEEVVRVRAGEPCGNDERIHLFQRRHYMDEESLIAYQAGGMDFQGIEAFDRWLAQDQNRDRILPMARCCVAFQVRRNTRERDDPGSLADFIKFQEFDRADKTTYLYCRNGDQVWRLTTEVEFGQDLFPDRDHESLLGSGQLWIHHSFGHKPVTDRQYREVVERAREAEARYRREIAAWRKLPKDHPDKVLKPWRRHDAEEPSRYEPLTPGSVWYDDAILEVNQEARHHNRIATVLQGLLDRSPVFQPHPPWRLWTPEGFGAGIELHYDDTRALTDGDAPEFELYRDELNRGIVVGTWTVGQQDAWERHEARRENDRQSRDYRIKHQCHYRKFRPYGNPGPGLIARVTGATRGACGFEWTRDSLRYNRWRDDQHVKVRFRCSRKLLLNVDLYRPGDFQQFYRDPRTRAQYLRWAPLMLAAEDWHAGTREDP